jgi:putative ABC transport system permease protein
LIGPRYLKYVWRSATRNKIRSLLTVLSVCISLAMMTVLYGYLAMQEAWSNEAARHHRVVVMNTQGFSGLVPIAYVDRVRDMPGVRAAVPYNWYGGMYKDERMPFAQFATDAKSVFDVWDEFEIDAEQLRVWQEDRRGCIVDRRMADRRGWTIGEHIPLQGTFFEFDLDLVLCGVYDSPQATDSLWFHWEYLDEGLKQRGNNDLGAGTIFAKVESADAVPAVCQAIDDRFANSDNPTRTQTEAAFAKMFADMLGNIRTYIRNIGLAVVFSLSLVAANAMAMALRERTTEIAVLKAIGFRRSRVLAMVLAESCLISLVGGVFGVALGCAMLQALNGFSPQLFPLGLDELAGPWMAGGIIVAAGIGIISGLFPAVRAAQLSVIDGLRRIA